MHSIKNISERNKIVTLNQELMHILGERVRVIKIFMYRRPTLYPLEIAVDFLKSL